MPDTTAMGLHGELLIRLVVGTMLGAIIGYERDVHGRPAGLRTHLLVALASTAFMLVSTYFVYFQHYGRGDLVEVDASRIAASVVTGVGFLGGGAILRTGLNVQGLTTAAGLWLVAAIGLSAGAGMYLESVVATALGVTALTALRRLEHKDDDVLRRRITVVLDQDAAPPLGSVLAALERRGIRAAPAEYERTVDERCVRFVFQARIPRACGDELLSVLEAYPGLRRVRVEPLS